MKVASKGSSVEDVWNWPFPDFAGRLILVHRGWQSGRESAAVLRLRFMSTRAVDDASGPLVRVGIRCSSYDCTAVIKMSLRPPQSPPRNSPSWSLESRKRKSEPPAFWSMPVSLICSDLGYIRIMTAMGRPSRFDPEMCEQAHNYCLLGATNDELGRILRRVAAHYRQLGRRSPRL